MRLDDELDRLYQLPLTEFTAARNALAKTSGPDAARVKALTKPPVAAWAVNQLYWRERRTYDALIEAAESLRATHGAVLGGKRADLRAAGKEHEEALERALKATLALLAEGGHPVTDASRQAIAQTLRALPASDPPGRLTRTLQPGGFEALAGISVAGRTPSGRVLKPGKVAKFEQPRKPAGAAKPAASAKERKQEEREAALADARAEATVAARELRQAEQNARRAEFESARAARAAEKTTQRVADARANLEAARRELEEAEAEATEAERQEKGARRAAEAAERELAAARKHVDTTEKQLERLKARS